MKKLKLVLLIAVFACGMAYADAYNPYTGKMMSEAELKEMKDNFDKMEKESVDLTIKTYLYMVETQYLLLRRAERSVEKFSPRESEFWANLPAGLNINREYYDNIKEPILRIRRLTEALAQAYEKEGMRYMIKDEKGYEALVGLMLLYSGRVAVVDFGFEHQKAMSELMNEYLKNPQTTINVFDEIAKIYMDIEALLIREENKKN